jgi:hypothetical protein
VTTIFFLPLSDTDEPRTYVETDPPLRFRRIRYR